MRDRGPNLGLFLLFVVMLQFGYPMTLQGQGWTLLYTLLYVGMIGFGLLVVRDQRDRVLPVLLVGVALVFFALWVALDPLRSVALLGLLATLFAFQVGVVYSLLKFVYRRSPAHSLNVIVAAISVYLLIGGVFATWFSATEILVPGSFTDSAHPDEPMTWQGFVYFSYVTLATLGYGDIVAVSPWTRSMAAAEAVTGTLFLTTVIARLVGMYVGVTPGEHKDGGAAD
ncbi:potassium channel family protein [Nocardiopsis sp. FIRDI 009]|uniref:potassium channel family protein n=1 Tax=Nocardiopsis sp. FIRDI 009 TaxID=714197 RepID=UPI001E393443|nr:potassium channel family protein [Nocardiopsis sp. FIRDI 009]